MNKGFTFVKLLVVMTIVSVLAVVSIPFFISHTNSTRIGVVTYELGETYRVAHLCYLDGVENVRYQDLKNNGFTLGEDIIINVENGFEETLLISGYHMKAIGEVFQIDHEGNVTRR